MIIDLLNITEHDIHELEPRDLDRAIAVNLLQWTNIMEEDFHGIKILRGTPYDSNKGGIPLPSFSDNFNNIAEVIETLVEDCRLCMEINRYNGVTSITLYDKDQDLEYVSCDYNHNKVPRLICEAALKYLADLPYEPITKEAEVHVCNMSVLPSGLMGEDMHTITQQC